MVHALQKGELSPSDVSDKVKDVADRMDDKDAKDYASTKHKGKPEHVPKEAVRKLRETIRQIVKENPAAADEALQAMQQAKVKNPQTGRLNRITTAYGDKSHPQHKKAKGIFQRLKDKFKKTKKNQLKVRFIIFLIVKLPKEIIRQNTRNFSHLIKQRNIEQN